MKRIILILFLVLTMTACAVTPAQNDEPQQSTIAITTEVATTPTETTTKADPTEDDSELGTVLKAIEPTLAYENLTITHNGNAVTVEYWYPGLEAAVSLAANGDEDRMELWNTYVENEKKQYSTLAALLDSEGFPDVSITWNVLNDKNTAEVLLSIIDGEVVYNAAN